MIKKGIAVSSGLGLAKAFKHKESKVNISSELVNDPKGQLAKLEQALNRAEKEILESKALAQNIMTDDDTHIFDVQLSILRDPYFLKEVSDLINKGHYASFAYDQIMNQYIDKVREIEDEYLKQRSVDLADVYKKMMHFLDALSRNVITITSPVVLVVKDLTPSDTIGLDFNLVKGIVSERGGKTSHASIIARTMGIPSVAGIRTNNIKNDDLLLVDGRYGTVSINPDENELVEYAHYLDRIKSKTKRLEPFKTKATKTSDGHQIKIGVNISNHLEAKTISYAEGVGLFRTEFLFMGSKEMPNIDQQIKAYEDVLKASKNELNIIRTLDIGGDKDLTYLPVKKELNPFLGQRAIRLSLANKQMFRTQLKAMLIANKWGNLGIMIPMIATLEELLEAKATLEDVKKDLIAQNYEIKPYQIGIMVEVPIVALGLEDIINEVDFVSIGSNDLIQYLFAADRMNEEVSYLYQPFHPHLLRLIKHVVKISHKYNKMVGVCGEIAGSKPSALLLLGLGVDELSMGYSSILEIRELIHHVSFEEAKQFVEEVIQLRTNEEVSRRANEFVKLIESRISK